uniref:Killer cell lectin-like receptor subfamily G, member 2 n=1 Tax=Nannospalax galili TaxID=1026970 RepID=A0A8C6RAZ7_NANGA
EQPQPQSPEGSPRPERAGREAEGADPEKQQPQGRRGPPLSLGYGAFRRLGSSSREPPSPGPAPSEQPRDSEAELQPWAAPEEPGPGPWAPMELQVDVRVKPVGAAGGSRAPSPAPSTRFLTVPVPESPGFSRRASPALPPLQRAPSPGATWGRVSPLAAVLTERAGPSEGRVGSPGSPACRCRCQEPGLTQEDAVLLQRAGMDGKKLPRAVTLMGLPMYMKSLRWALVVMAVFLAVCTVTIVALASTTGARCQPCPHETQDLEGSRAFCSARHATLLLLNHTQ